MENKEEIKTSKKEKNINRTYKEQKLTEEAISKLFSIENFDITSPESFETDVIFNTNSHMEFAKKMIRNLPGSYSGIDAGLPWFSYWVLNIFEICNMNKYEFSYEQKLKFVNYLKELQHEDGGFCGYSKGLPHLVSNYAAMMAIVNLGIKEAYDIVDREKMKSFLKRMKSNNIMPKETNKCSEYKVNQPGTFQMHENGESDLRASYCALTVAYLLNIVDEELLEGVFDNIRLCQTFEGGLGPEPFNEAHGGYSYCGIATLVLFNQLNIIDVDRFILWLVNKQMPKEGGFQGRTNKLVDSCYSFWQGSIFNLLALADESKYSHEKELLYDQLGLQAYILLCCQNDRGGLWDKPGKPVDLFHTNYASAGLALSQKSFLKDAMEELKVTLSFSDTLELKEMDPIFCVSKEKLINAKEYYLKLKN